jgi:hypothetical protein
MRQLSPEARSRVIAQMESAVAQASPDSRPALEDLLRQVKALDEPKAPADTTPNVQTSLDRFRKLKPEQRRKVIESMEAEAAKAPPSAKAGYAALLAKLRGAEDKPSVAPVNSSQKRIRSSLANYRQLDAEGRAIVLAQLEADAETAEPRLRQTLQALIQRLKAIPPTASTKPLEN